MKFYTSLFVLAASLIGLGLCTQQYVTLYENMNQLGANLTLDRHYANLSEHSAFLREASSFCAVGWIAFFTNYDYNAEGGVAFLIDSDDTAPKCENRIFSNFHSMRYMGSENSDVPGVSFYSKTSYHGAEVYVGEDGTVDTGLTFPALSYVTSGWANFTFFTGTNFTGDSWCTQSTQKVTLVPEIDVSFGAIASVAVGCNN